MVPVIFNRSGTVSDNAIEVLPGVTRIIPRDVALRRMLTCGHVVIDISLDRGELKLAMDYMARKYLLIFGWVIVIRGTLRALA